MWLYLPSLVFAQETGVSETTDQTSADLTERIKDLETQLLALQEDSVVSQADQLLLKQQLEYLSIIIDTRHPEVLRRNSIEALNQGANPSSLPFYWSLMCRSDVLTFAILDGMTNFEYSSEVYNILDKGLHCPRRWKEPIAIKSISVIGKLQQEELAEVLWHTVSNPSFTEDIRSAALTTLETEYADYLQKKGSPIAAEEESFLANFLVSGATGLTGSILLGSVGTWGQTDVGIGIGYTGGAIMGAAGGWLYSAQHKPTDGQALLFASSVGWGLTESLLFSLSLDLDENWFALSNTVGTLAGAGYGYWARERDIASADVIEMNFMGYWGAQMAVGLNDLIGVSRAELSSPEYPEELYELDYEDERYEILEQEYNDSYEEFYNELDKLNRRRIRLAMLGSATGMLAGHWLMEPWEVREESSIFAALYAAELAAASMLMIPAYDIEDPQGMVRLAIHGAAAGAFVYDYFHPVSYEQSIFGAYGSGAGHLLGAGIPFFLNADDEQIANGALWMGLAGTIAGSALGNHMQFNTSDWVMTGVGLPVAGWHLGSLATIAQDYNWFAEDQYDQATGLVMTGMGLAAVGLGYSGYRHDLSINDSLFLGSSTVWGGCYGALIPLAFGFSDQLDDTEHLLFSLISSDVFLGTSSYLISSHVGFDSRRAAIPQLLGITGATVASVGTFLFFDTEQAFGLAALGGATAGFVGGAVLEKKRAEKDLASFRLHHPQRFALDNSIQMQVAPQLDQDGEMGLWIGIHN